MIRNSFIFLPRIGHKKEINIWNQGIRDWDEFLTHKVKGISHSNKNHYNKELTKAKRALYSGDSSFFCRLNSSDSWRLYEFFRDETVFLDIETSGTSMKSYLTVIGIYDGFDSKVMVKNIDTLSLRNELQKYKLIVTYNGSSFDLPYLNKKYPNLIPQIPHFDLKHACLVLGLKGGLKDIESRLNIKRRNQIIERFYDGDPLKLWRLYAATWDDYYLKLLIEYNEEDVVNLKNIADYVVSELTSQYNNFLK